MDAQRRKHIQAVRRKYRVRGGIKGTAAKPRLTVFRSNLHITAQLVDDDAEVTVCAAASNGKDLKLKYGGNIAAAVEVGKKLAEKAKAKGVTVAAFDRGAYRFHGRVKALAQAATAAGLVCTGPPEPPKEKPAEGDAAAKDKAAPKKEKGEKPAGGEKKKEKKEPAKA
jgi:large subunit ribosomal protein L18